MNTNREEKALFEFKHIMDDLMQLLGQAVGAQTGYLYWVNRSRQQFVLETTYKMLPNVMFKDRIAFDKFFLNKYKDIQEPLKIQVDRDIDRSELHHYFDAVPVKHLYLIPFQNNGQTIALSVLETKKNIHSKEMERAISSYINAHINVLNTYLELTDLYDDQNKWIDYENSLNQISVNQDDVEILNTMAEEMQKLLPGGGVSVGLRGMETWVTVLRSENAPTSPETGLMVEEKSMAYDALQKGKPLFSIHFNQNPKRVSSSERSTEGATLAIPVLISDRRLAVVLAYDKNPLTFKESVKHQLKNLVRVASCTIQAKPDNKIFQKDLFTTEYGSFVPEIWKSLLQKQVQRIQFKEESAWFGLIGIDNLSELRSRLRLEDLKKLQRLLVKALNPSRLGYNGLIGFNSDYVFSYLLFGATEQHHQEWLSANMNDLKNKLDFGDGRKLEVFMKAGSVQLDSEQTNINEIVTDAKQALSMAMKNRDATIVNM